MKPNKLFCAFDSSILCSSIFLNLILDLSFLHSFLGNYIFIWYSSTFLIIISLGAWNSSTWYILFYNFLVTHEIWWLFLKLIWNWYPGFFFSLSKFDLIFTVSALFLDQVLFFVYVFCWNDECILGNINHIWVYSF